MGVQLDLAGAVEQHIVLFKLLQSILKPLKVVLQILQCVQNATVRPELVVAHNVFQLDQAANVERNRIVGVVVCRV